jgi:hypothetical protein
MNTKKMTFAVRPHAFGVGGLTMRECSNPFPRCDWSGRYPGFWQTWEVCDEYQRETWVNPYDLP